MEVNMGALPLTACRNGDEGTVIEVAGVCNTAKRLAELGVHTGGVVRVVRAGIPMIVEAGNARLCLRADMADSIMVHLHETHATA